MQKEILSLFVSLSAGLYRGRKHGSTLFPLTSKISTFFFTSGPAEFDRSQFSQKTDPGRDYSPRHILPEGTANRLRNA